MEEDFPAWQTNREGKKRLKSLRQKFSSAVKRGSGEAVLIIKQYPQIDFFREIIRSVISTRMFDAQSEGTREQYYYDLINASHHKNYLISKVILLLCKDRRDDWAIEQLFNLCAMFAKAGNVEAKNIVYTEYIKKRNDETPWLGEEAIIFVDGIKGKNFLFKHNKYNYVQRLSVCKKRSIKKTKYYSYEFLKEKINSKNFILFPVLIKSVSKSVINKIAYDFINENKSENKLKYLRFFCKIKFPYGHKLLLKVLKSLKSNRNLNIELCVDALKFFKSDDVRKYAVKKLKQNRNTELYFNLFINNYRKGDAELLLPLVQKQNTPDKAHSIVWSIVDIYNKNKVKECKEIMEILYHNLACGTHRSDVVKIMFDNNVLSRSIRREIKYDSYLKTRKFS